MFKKINVLVSLLLLGCFFVSCASSSKVEIIEDQGTAFGTKAPEWVVLYAGGAGIIEIENLEKYRGKKAFIHYNHGDNLDYLTRQANTTGLGEQVAQLARTAVIANVQEIAKGVDADYDVAAFEASVHQSAAAQFRGLTRESSWWQKVRVEGVEEYRLYTLSLMDMALLDQQFNLLVAETTKNLDNAELRSAIQKNDTSALDLMRATQDLEASSYR